MTDSPLTQALEKAREAFREAFRSHLRAAIASTAEFPTDGVFSLVSAAHDKALSAFESTLAAEMKRMDLKVVGREADDAIVAQEPVGFTPGEALWAAMHDAATCELQKARGGDDG